MREQPLAAVVRANHEIFMLTSDRITGVLGELGLTHATAQALWALDPEGPAPSMKALAGQLFCNAPNLSFVVNQLVERGLVERDTDPGDRRSRVVVLTAEGRRTRERVMRVTLEETPFAGCEPEELDQLAEILRRVLARAGRGPAG
ncbi:MULTISPECIES: MarR family winged helix-turn-helix transcriptional regulator [Streptomyces]|uniref:Winged helix-turn-helix transcriptional regulator n=1 Tax=Streptomyces lycii TaxID=2654337 RepID=A0ABQ7FFD1_9ACTN|nr:MULTISPECIES: MarR family winged helix-turn-helix transcriptional regulator [Streptomyces]KAF4407084.1 winged helix-turn-helix transcriptional regulator [Streptomyces lycii]PGH47747.1 MarR family transcriptional regulator [Streptomyces sp. Ru87]